MVRCARGLLRLIAHSQIFNFMHCRFHATIMCECELLVVESGEAFHITIIYVRPAEMYNLGNKLIVPTSCFTQRCVFRSITAHYLGKSER